MSLAAEKKKNETLLNQLALFRDEFEALLKECPVKPFPFESETIVSSEIRSRIHIVGGESAPDQRTRIAETVQCGYLYEHGDEGPMLLRNAEVTIG